jgi:hypothetical protein
LQGHQGGEIGENGAASGLPLEFQIHKDLIDKDHPLKLAAFEPGPFSHSTTCVAGPKLRRNDA